MLTTIRYPALFTDYYELTMAQGYFLSGMTDQPARFDYFFRKLPFEGGYVIFAGLETLLEALGDLTFQDDDIRYLKQQGFHADFLAYLQRFSFKGAVHAVPEGEVIFPDEPALIVTGNIIETQLVETVLLNILNFQSLIATKASRVKRAAGKLSVMDFGLRRAQGLGGIHASRAAIIGGVDSTSNAYSAAEFGLKAVGTMAHSWVETFETELTAFRTFAEQFPQNSTLLVDTYDTLGSGVPNAITVANEMKAKGQSLHGIRLDSGDLAYLSKRARAMLDDAGLRDVKIVASNQLDEHIIKSLLDQGARIDVFGVGTSLVVGREDAALDGVYKLSMYGGKPKLKISDNAEKILLPGAKKVYRYTDDAGTFCADAIVGVDEDSVGTMFHPHIPLKQLDLRNFKAEPMLRPVMETGRSLFAKQSVKDIAGYSASRLALLPEEHKRFENPHVYKVGISETLMHLRNDMVMKYRNYKS